MRHIYLLLTLIVLKLNLFCQQSDKMVLDSSFRYYWDAETDTWLNNIRRVYTYDPDGNQITLMAQNWNSETHDWSGFYYLTYSYDSYGNLIVDVTYFWESDLCYWAPCDRNSNKYDTDGNKIEIINYINLDCYDNVDSIKENWENDERYVYTYDENGNLIQETEYYWGTEETGWRIDERFINIYDSSNNKTEEIWEAWDSMHEIWIRVSHWIYTYDNDGKIVDGIRYYRYFDFDIDTSFMVKSSYISYIYDSLGNNIEKKIYRWNSKINEWVNDERFVYAYDENVNKTEETSYDWDPDSLVWVGNIRKVYEYDTKGNLTEDFMYVWDPEIKEWVGTSYSCPLYNCNGGRFVFFYDMNGNKIEEVLYNWDTITNSWIYFEKTVYYWSTGDESIPDNHIHHNYIICPNPFSDYTIIRLMNAAEIRRIDIIDMYGRTVRSIDKINSDLYSIYRENLSGGIYFFRIHSDKVFVIKVIIQ